MQPDPLAKSCTGRMHYVCAVLAVTFTLMLTVVGLRSAPGMAIVPLRSAFGWSVRPISGAVSLNILLMGLTGLAGTSSLKRSGDAVAARRRFRALHHDLAVAIASDPRAGHRRRCEAGAVGLAAAIANRWFATRRGLVRGC